MQRQDVKAASRGFGSDTEPAEAPDRSKHPGTVSDDHHWRVRPHDQQAYANVIRHLEGPDVRAPCLRVENRREAERIAKNENP